MLNVQTLPYSSTCAHCEEGVEGGEGIRLVRTLGTGRTGFDFHKDCFDKVMKKAAGLYAVDLLEIDGVYQVPEVVPGKATASDPAPSIKKQIPKRRT